jgi:hypothetical protein
MTGMFSQTRPSCVCVCRCRGRSPSITTRRLNASLNETDARFFFLSSILNNRSWLFGRCSSWPILSPSSSYYYTGELPAPSITFTKNGKKAFEPARVHRMRSSSASSSLIQLPPSYIRMKRIQRDKSSPLKKIFFLRTRLITPHKKGRLMDQPPPGGWQQINSLPDPSG